MLREVWLVGSEMMLFVSRFVYLLTAQLVAQGIASTAPEQIHVSATDDPRSIVVTWLTLSPVTDTPLVQYDFPGARPLSLTANGHTSSYTTGSIVRYVHRVTLNALTPDTKYDYRCGSPANWSDYHTLKTLGSNTLVTWWSPTFLVYGDFGYDNAQSLPRLKEEVDGGGIDCILHAGDMGYDMFDHEGGTGDNFMNMIQDIATKIPYMVCPGNHEIWKNYTDYKSRFSMPGGHDSLYYSVDIGPAHIIMFSTEVYIAFETRERDLVKQYNWLEEDLKRASTDEALKEHPWIIALAHRPMYCSTTTLDRCNYKENKIRVGLPGRKYALEDLFYKYGVDIYISAHQHLYERMWPVYDAKVMNGSTQHPYTNPRGPVHIITGSAGCREGRNHFLAKPPWVAHNNRDYGYSKMTVHNGTHISFKQISDDQAGEVVDSITIIKEAHGSKAYHH